MQNLNSALAEQLNIASGFNIVNLATAANAGLFVSLKNYERVAIVFMKGIGAAGEDPTITVQQATAVAGTAAKALNFTRAHKKQHATALPGAWTLVEQASGNTFTHTDLAEELAVVMIDIKAEDLDVDGGFDCVGASVADVGSTAQLAVLFYILYGAKYAPPLSAIAD